jgi:predicted permease
LEIEHHLAEATDRLVTEGWEPTEARREAERRFGNAARYGPRMRRMDETRRAIERWTGAWDVVRQSLASVARTARRSPGFTVAVVVTLGLGIGANATMYGIIDRLLLRPPEHIVQPEQVRRVLVSRWSPITGVRGTQTALAYPDYEDLKAHSGIAVAAYEYEGERTFGSGATATRARSALASAELFPLLGVQPRLGRFFTAEEARVGAALTVVLSEEYWRSAYASDPDALGRSIEIGDHSAPIIGVAPAGFTGADLQSVDLWLPLEAASTLESDVCFRGRDCYWMGAVARLAVGVSLDAAEAEATRLHQNGRSDQVEQGRYSDAASIVLGPLNVAGGLYPFAESQVAKWLTGVSLVVLLIACANVANLLLVRGTRQRRETAVRLALGLSRRRLVAETVFESVTLALVGGALGLALALGGGGLVRSTFLAGISFPESSVNERVVLFTALIAVLAGAIAATGPALQASRPDVTEELSSGSSGNSRTRSRLRGFLSVAQGALSVVLLVGAGLFVRSLAELRALDLGLDTDRLIVAQFEFTRQVEPAISREAYDVATRAVAALPEVESAVGTATPFGVTYAISLRVPGLDSLPRLPGGGPYLFSVTPGYFETVGLSVVSGRAIDERDAGGAAKAVVVSETMARLLWPEDEPLGKCLLVGTGEETCATVVGVVEDAARGGYRDRPYMGYYLAMAQIEGWITQLSMSAPTALYIRARGDAARAEAAVAAALRGVSPEVRWARVYPMRDTLDREARSWTLGSTMFTVFGLLALFVAAVGLYSVLAFEVAQRTRELGIRAALGAEKARLMRMVLGQGIRLSLLGIALGLASAFVAAPYTRDLLFEVSPRDPGVFAGVGLVLLAVSLAASLVPGLRATRVDPVAALKSE